MFAVSEKQRRSCLRVIFLLFCALPTLVVLCWSIYRITPLSQQQQRRYWESRLTGFLGLSVSLGRVELPLPKTIVFQNVKLSDAETGLPVATAPRIEATKTERGYVLLVSQGEIHESQFQRLKEVLHDRLLRAPNWPAGSFEILIEHVEIVASNPTQKQQQQAHSLSDVRVLLTCSEQQRQLALEFRISDLDMADLARLRMLRSFAQSTPTTRWEFDGGATPLPCYLLHEVLPALKMLGQDCHFRGMIWGEQTPKGWQGDINGQLTAVDLSRLVSDQFPHRLSGIADIELRRGMLRHGRLIHAAGSLRSGPGEISRSLLIASVEELSLQTTQYFDDLLVPYQQLAFGFSIGGEEASEEQGLLLSGHCDQHGTVLDDTNGPILIESSTRRPLPVVSLVRVLVPQNDVKVPAAKETDLLLRVLPIAAVRRADQVHATSQAPC